MEATETRSTLYGPRPEETTGPGFHQFASSTSSFTALLELPPNQAVDLLVHTPETIDISDTTFQRQSNKRKDRDTKDKESNRKNRKTGEDLKGGVDKKLPYVHVRARRGQATDSHSIAERARREKINARMKLLQELVPGCNKISGTASVLDEIINHVQSLQRHVELLSMSLAAVHPGIDMKLDAYMAANGSLLGSNHLGIATPSVWSNEQIKPQYQHLCQLDGFQHPVWVKEEDTSNFVAPDTSLLSYDSSENSAPLQTNDLKMQL